MYVHNRGPLSNQQIVLLILQPKISRFLKKKNYIALFLKL